jgi:hypothetical protein
LANYAQAGAVVQFERFLVTLGMTGHNIVLWRKEKFAPNPQIFPSANLIRNLPVIPNEVPIQKLRDGTE